MKHIDHHSIALLAIALLEVNIVPESSKKAKQRVTWDIRDESESDGNEETNEAELTADQKRMKEVLHEKGLMVVDHLLDQLSPKNQDDMHKALNASTVLLEFVDNETCFPILTQQSSLKKLVGICFQTENNRQNLPYALGLLSAIINQFIDHEKNFFQDKKEEFFQIFSHYFTDLVYNCIIILRQHSLAPGDQGVNTTGQSYIKIGIHRVRAIEQLRTLFVALGKRGSLKESPLLSELLRRKVIETMLFMIKTFPFCSVSHQQAILILNSLKEAFDLSDLATLKDFVKTELEAQEHFNFDSGRKTSGMNMGQII